MVCRGMIMCMCMDPSNTTCAPEPDGRADCTPSMHRRCRRPPSMHFSSSGRLPVQPASGHSCFTPSPGVPTSAVALLYKKNRSSEPPSTVSTPPLLQ